MAYQPLRSVLFVPGTRPDRYSKAFSSGADAVVLDLEDAVEDRRKEEARSLVGQFLAGTAVSGPLRLVRVNAPGSRWFRDDLQWLRTDKPAVDAIVVPKVETTFDLGDVASVAPEGRVIPLLETARGILSAPEILSTSAAEVPAVLFGAEDLTAELGVPRTLDGEEILYARSRVVLAAATIGADAIDAVWVQLAPLDTLRTDAARAKALGFRGKMAIHPDQVATINQVFSPTVEEVAAARKLVDASDRSAAGGDGVFRLDHNMVDAPVIKRARRVLDLAARTTHN